MCDMVTVEFQRECIGLQKNMTPDIFSLWEQFKTPTQRVVAYKGGTLEKTFLTQLKIPFVNLEEYGCPKLDYLPDTYYPLVNRPFACRAGTGHWRYMSAILD